MVVEIAWGDRVIAARTKLRCTQTQFAKKLGLSRETIVGWELRRTRPYSAEAEYFLLVEREIEDMPDEDVEKWLGPEEPEAF